MIATIVGILTFISMIIATSESLKARKVYIFQHLSFYEQFNFRAQLSEHEEKSFITLGPGYIHLFNTREQSLHIENKKT